MSQWLLLKGWVIYSIDLHVRHSPIWTSLFQFSQTTHHSYMMGISFTLSVDHNTKYSHDFFAFSSWRFKWWGACPSALRGIQSLHPSGLQEQWNTSDCLKLHCDKFIKRCCKGELLCDDKTFSLYLMLRLLNWARTYSTLHLLALERVKWGELLRVQRTF